MYKSKQIAILGAGFSGLATAWHLLQLLPDSQIKVFDPAGIGGGTSGIAAGLMHPYAGAHAKLNWQGRQGWQSTRSLLEVATTALDQPVAEFSGLMRLATTFEQQQDYIQCASKYEDVTWLNASQCQELIPGIHSLPGIYIQSAVTVNSPLYLKGLWLACQKYNATLEQIAIKNLKEIQDFDAIVVAMGASSTTFSELAHLPTIPVKGQVLELAWPDLPPLPLAINSHAYMVMNQGNRSCIAGATYERNFTCISPNLEIAINDILPKVQAFLPGFGPSSVLECRAGIRASTPDHLPFARRINKQLWTLFGMGSKGLLYHSLFAEKLSREIHAALQGD